MDKRIRGAIAKIEIVGSDGSCKSRGTGFLVTADKVLTALHVVANRNSDPPDPISGRLILSFPDYKTTGRIVEDLLDAGEDWVLLACQESPPAQPIPFGVRHESGTPFETFGFPDANPRDGMVQTGTLEDDGANLDGIPAFQLFSKQAAAGNGAPIKGLSGAPVIIDGAVVGLLRFALMTQQRQTVAGTLYACPVSSVLQRTGDALPVPDPLHGLPGIPRRTLPAAPFRYLEHFTEDDAEIFFGRGPEIADLYGLLTSEDGPPVILLYGQSGVGKSSLLGAGVVPRLRWVYESVYIRREEGSTLVATMIDSLSPLEERSSLADAWTRREQHLGKPLVVVLDQVEEVYTRPVAGRGNELGELCAAISEWVDSERSRRSRLLLSFRKEWYPEIHKQFELRNLGHGDVFLERLGREGVLDVLNNLSRSRRITQHYGLVIEPGLAELIADELAADRDSAIAPTLQILLTKMWKVASRNAPDSPRFTVDLYYRLKREGLLLGDFLEQQLAMLRSGADIDVDSGLALDLLAHHTTPLSTACERSRDELRQAYRHVGDRLDRLLENMVGLYLLSRGTASSPEAEPPTRLGHDTLAPVVRNLVNRSEQPGHRARRILENRAREWQDGTDGTPLDQHDLRIVERGLKGTRALSEDEDRMLETSRRLRDRQRRNRGIQLGLAAVAAVTVVAAGLWGLWEQAQIKRQEVLTALSGSTDQVSYLLSVEPVSALMAAVAAAGRSHEVLDGAVQPALQYSLNRAVNESWETALLTHGSPVTSIAVSPTAGRFASAGENGLTKIWNIPTHASLIDQGGVIEPVATIQTQQGRINDVSYASDGSMLASAGGDGTVRLWDAEGRSLGKALGGHIGPVLSVVLGPGNQPISAGADGTVRRWTGDGEPVGSPIDAHGGSPVTALAVDASRGILLSGSAGGAIRIWNPARGESLSDEIEAHQGKVEAIAISPVEGLFATAGSDGAIRLWDLHGRPVGSRRSHESAATALAFRADGLAVVSGSENFDVHLIEVTRTKGVGRLLAPPFKGIDGVVSSLALSPDDGQIIVGSRDGTIRIGDWFSSQVELPRHTGFVPDQVAMDGASGDIAALGMSANKLEWRRWSDRLKPEDGAMTVESGLVFENAVISHDGDMLAGVYAGNKLVVRTLQEDARPVVNAQVDGQVTALAFGREDAVLAVAHEERIDLLDTADGRPIATVVDVGLTVRKIDFSREGNAMAAVHERCVMLWNLRVEGNALTIDPVTPDSQSRLCTEGRNTFSAVAVDAKGGYVAAGDAFGNLTLWRREGTALRTAVSFKAHNGAISLVAFRPDTGALISGSSGYRLRLWNLEGDLLAEFAAEHAEFLDLAFDERGSKAVSSEVDKTVKVWATHWVEWLKTGCERLTTHVSYTHPESNNSDRAKQWAQDAAKVCKELLPGLVNGTRR